MLLRQFLLCALSCSACCAFGLTAAVAVAADNHFIALVSDGDSHPFNWFGARLGEPWQAVAPGHDALSILRLGSADSVSEATTLPVGNSWQGPSRAMAIAPDGNTVFVVESQQSRSEVPTAKGPADLGPGHFLRAIDVSNRTRPKLIGELVVADGTSAISIDSAGKTLLLSGGDPKTGDIGFVSWNGSRFGPPQYFHPPGLGSLRSLRGERARVTGAMWNPKRDLISVVAENAQAVSFYRVHRTPRGTVDHVSLDGQPVTLNRGLFAGTWSADGRYWIDNETLWPTDLSEIDNWAPTLIEVVRLAQPALPYGKTNHHQITNGVDVARSCEGMAMSHDGKWLATVSLGQSWWPKGHAFHTPSTVTLLKFDSATGTLAPVDKYEFEGVMPEDITFTPDDHQVIATVYNYQDDPNRGGLEVFDITATASGAALKHVSTIKVAYGVNSIVSW